MAEGVIARKVNCGVENCGDSFQLCYRVGSVEKNAVRWDWIQRGDKFVAQMEATTKSGEVRRHESDPIDADTVNQLDKPKWSLDGNFLKVKLKLKKKSSGVPNLKKFFCIEEP